VSEVSLARFQSCKKCGVTYPATPEFFSRKKELKLGVRNECKSCVRSFRQANKTRIRAQRREYLTVNTEKNAERVRRWRENNKEAQRAIEYRRGKRLREEGRKLPKRELLEMYRDQGGLCAYCEKPLEESYEMDHMTPLSRGGTTDWTNIALSCQSCNARKATRTPAEFWESHLRHDFADTL
jgi:5-methylcytosine-specific restriction endonuclease McrA